VLYARVSELKRSYKQFLVRWLAGKCFDIKFTISVKSNWNKLILSSYRSASRSVITYIYINQSTFVNLTGFCGKQIIVDFGSYNSDRANCVWKVSLLSSVLRSASDVVLVTVKTKRPYGVSDVVVRSPSCSNIEIQKQYVTQEWKRSLEMISKENIYSLVIV